MDCSTPKRPDLPDVFLFAVAAFRSAIRLPTFRYGSREDAGRNSLDFHDDVSILHDRRIPFLAHPLIQTVLSRLNIELPSVPRTRHDIAAHRTFAQWPTGMGTNSVHHVNLAIHVEDAKDSPFSDDLRGLARGQ